MIEKGNLQDHLRILIADDNICDQNLMIRVLKHMNLSADVASNGLEVIRALQGKNYNVILMDVQMPEMNGLETTRIIRQRWHERCIKIIAVTSCNQKGDKETCIKSGMDEYITKPIAKKEICDALSRCCIDEIHNA
jgi:CheY-like chemotaxis protein